MQRIWANLARNLHLGGIRRKACTQSRRLITRRSQVQILPRYCESAGDGAFRAPEAALARGRASALDVLPAHRSTSGQVSAGRVTLIVLGSIGVLFGLALMAGGGFLLWADRTQRDDGYLTTASERFATPTYALTRTRLELDTNGEGWVLNESWAGKVRIRGESPAGKTLFIGIGPQAEVARYLGSVAHANVQDIDFDPFRVTYLPIAGGAPQGPPTKQRFWAVSASGVGTQTVTWKVREGDWSVVLMNADGSRGVVADVDLGAKLSFLLWVAIGLLIGGVLVAGGSVALIVLAARTRPPPPPAPSVPPTAAHPSASAPPTEPPDRSTEEPPP